ncbi:oligosaccharide flippase family protein [Streptococcus suis]|nr:oligosaccharide flippase family protein [Streptococcus suis]
MKIKTKRLLKDTVIFTIGNIGSKFIQFFLVPLYTYSLTKSEFGVTEFIFTVANLVTPLFSFSISDGLIRFGLDRSYEKNVILTNSVVIILIGTLLSILCYPLFSTISILNKYIPLFLIILNIRIFRDVFSINLKLQDQNKLFAVDSILFTASTFIYSILFLKIFNLGIFGFFYSQILANICSIIFLVIVGNVKASIRINYIDKNIFWTLICFSFPMMVNAISWWVTNAVDRVILTRFVSSSSVGLYAVATKIPSFVTTFTGIFNQAWILSAVGGHGDKDELEFVSQTFRNYCLAMYAFALLLINFSESIVSIYVNSEYFEAWRYVPFLLTGTVFSGVAGFLGGVLITHKKNIFLMWSTVFGAILSVILNILFVPRLNIMGSVYTNCITWFIVAFLRLIFVEKCKHLNTSIIKIFFLSLQLVLQSFIVIHYPGYSYMSMLLFVVLAILAYSSDFVVFIAGIYRKR